MFTVPLWPSGNAVQRPSQRVVPLSNRISTDVGWVIYVIDDEYWDQIDCSDEREEQVDKHPSVVEKAIIPILIKKIDLESKDGKEDRAWGGGNTERLCGCSQEVSKNNGERKGQCEFGLGVVPFDKVAIDLYA